MNLWKNNLNNVGLEGKLNDYSAKSKPVTTGVLDISKKKKEGSRMVGLLILLSMILSLIGFGCLLWQNEFPEQNLSLSGIMKADGKENEEVAFWKMLPELIGFGGERTYLVLFQNDMELRPSGGYLGNFGIAKIKNGDVVDLAIHDTNIFDGFGQAFTLPPFPISNYLKQSNWQMRDGNWSPDFPTAAEQVEYFYHLQGGTEKFDGIVAVNASVLPDILKITGPVYLKDYDVRFEAEDVLYQLEHEVEMAFWQKGIETGDRKGALKALVAEVMGKLSKEDILQENSELRKLVARELAEKNIQIYLKNEKQQQIISDLGWAGEVKKDWPENYLMINEANLGALKSNFFVTRSVEYKIDYSKQRPEVYLSINYNHANPNKDWFNEDYRFYLRVYLPAGCWLVKSAGTESEVRFLDEMNKTVLGAWVIVPAGSEKSVNFKLLLKEEYGRGSGEILIQKQSGVFEIPFELTVVDEDGKESQLLKTIKTDWLGKITKAQS